MIDLAQRAENYIQRQQREQNHSSGTINTKTNLENRPSKQKRIQQAIKRN